jgi:hypothetical protein
VSQDRKTALAELEMLLIEGPTAGEGEVEAFCKGWQAALETLRDNLTAEWSADPSSPTIPEMRDTGDLEVADDVVSLMGLPVIYDSSVPDDEVQLRRGSRVVGRITNLGPRPDERVQSALADAMVEAGNEPEEFRVGPEGMEELRRAFPPPVNLIQGPVENAEELERLLEQETGRPAEVRGEGPQVLGRLGPKKR